MKLSSLKIDSAKAEQGAWIGDIPDCGDLALRVRGSQNADARRLRAKLIDAVPRDQRINGRIDPAALDAIATRIMAETIVMDWSGLAGDDGQPILFSREAASRLLSDPDLRLFRDAVAWASERVGENAVEQIKADVGN